VLLCHNGKIASNIDGGESSRCTSNGPTQYFGSVPVWARSIIGTGIQKRCPYQYLHYTLVQYRYGHGPLPVLAFQNGAQTSTGIFALWFSTGIGTVYYQYCIELCPYQYWQICTWIQYPYGHIPLPELAFNCARTSIGFLHFGSVPVWADSITGTDNQ
jgi:hypothetical protein